MKLLNQGMPFIFIIDAVNKLYERGIILLDDDAFLTPSICFEELCEAKRLDTFINPEASTYQKIWKLKEKRILQKTQSALRGQC